MLRLVMALDCEAKPLREYWRLKPLPAQGFRLYGNEHTQLILSGPGLLNAAAACAYLAGRDALAGSTTAWLNLGVAGHRVLPLGTPILASTIRRDTHTWYPSLVMNPPCTLATVQTVDQPETHYPEEHSYEMEAAGFYPTASRFASAELVQVLKIISDNQANPLQQLNAPRISELIAATLPMIDALCSELRELAAELATQEADPPAYLECLERWHFSASQQVQLRRLLQRHRLLLGDTPDLSRLRNAREVLRSLQQALVDISPQIENPRRSLDL